MTRAEPPGVTLKIGGLTLTGAPAAALRALGSPAWLPLLLIFAVVYGPFFLQYGWGYWDYINVDLPTFYAASVSVFKHGASPYGPERLQLLMGSTVPVFPYLYPPPSLLVFFPLSLLTYAGARHAVLIINHLLLLGVIWAIPLRLLRASPGHRPAVFALCIVYTLTFYPVVVTLNHGQVSFLLLAFLLLFWLLARSGRALLAALFLALAIVLKTYPVILVPLLLLIGRRREGLYAVAWLAVATVVSLVCIPASIWHDWLTNVLVSGGYARMPAGLFTPAAVWNQSLNGFFARAFTQTEWSRPLWVNPDLARLLAYAAAGVVAIVTGLAAWRSRVRSDSLDRTMLVALPAIFLVAPFSWEHHLVYLIPPVLMLLNSRHSLGGVAAVLFFFLCVASAVLIGMPGDWLAYKFYGVLGLWILGVFAACSRRVTLPSECVAIG